MMNNEEGRGIAEKIDGGIWAEWSISYWYEKAMCSICHKPIGLLSYLLGETKDPCLHKIGAKDGETGQVCYWYPDKIVGVSEISSVWRGAYRKTKNLPYNGKDELAMYGDEEADGIMMTNRILKSHNGGIYDGGNEKGNEGDGGEGSGVSGGEATGGDDATSNGGDEGGNGEARSEAGERENEGRNVIAEILREENGADDETEAIRDAMEQYGISQEKVNEIKDGLEKERCFKYDTFVCECGKTAELKPTIDECVCDKCGHKQKKEAGKPCVTTKCEKCGEKKMSPVISYGESMCECGAIMEARKYSHKEGVCEACGYKTTRDTVEENCVECGAPVKARSVFLSKAGVLVGVIKPVKGEKESGEYYDIEQFKGFENGRYWVAPKYDGVFFEMHFLASGAVKLFTAAGNEHTEKFPRIIEEAKGIGLKTGIIVGEMVKYRGRKRGFHPDVVGYLQSKKEGWDDDKMRFKPFHIVHLNGESLEKKPYSETREILDKNVPWGERIHPTKGEWVEHERGGEKIVRAIKDRKTREGAMVKSAEMTYTSDGRDQIWKWKQQYELDVVVEGVQEKEGADAWMYTCAVGISGNRITIGETYSTAIKASKGDILRVSVDYVVHDKESGSYSWYAPKVVEKRGDKKRPDPLKSVERIAMVTADRQKQQNELVLLGDVVPALKRVTLEVGNLWLTGGLVENGYSSHDVDIVTRVELSDEDRGQILTALSMIPEGKIDFIIDENGPAGPSLELKSDMAEEELAKWKYGNKFVIQEHGWGKHKHYDLRFGAPKTPRMWGWTCFTKPTTKAGGDKVRCQEKKYHDPYWMDVDKKTIKPGERGHPGKDTYKGNAHMVKIDEGKYEYIQRDDDFLEVVLHGKEYKGRYIWRKIKVKNTKNSSSLKIAGDETGLKSEAFWIMWKPKDQKVKGVVNKLEFRWDGSILMFWETNEPDNVGGQPDGAGEQE
jgi:bifunctional non-homologous end joining protein LigD